MEALQLLVVDIGVTYKDLEPGVEPPQRTGQAATNLNFFFAHDLPAVIKYKLDVTMLKTVSSKICLAGGSASRDSWPYHCAAALAKLFGTEIVEFPSDHVGYMTHPQSYAERLHKVLND